MNALVARPLARAPVRVMGQVRTKTSLIPPNVASLKELGKLQSTSSWAHPVKFAKLKHLYAHLPKGPKNNAPASNAWERYWQKNSENAKPLWHFLAIMIPFGAYVQYNYAGHCE
ncbi:hypothetical protein HDV00_011147 [Rhizophlyctis rosea]|nr:hypothetical protein HDV00_011147 [Rhizophlyctis rosea]